MTSLFREHKQLMRWFFVLIIVAVFYQNCANQFRAIDGLNAKTYSSLEAQKTLSELQQRSSVGYQSTSSQVDLHADPLFLDRMTLFLVIPASVEITSNELFVMTSGGAENDQFTVMFDERRENVIISRISDPENFLTYQIPIGVHFNRQILAINMKQKPQLEKIMLNGSVLNISPTETGLPGDFSFLIKEVKKDHSIQSIMTVEDLTWYEMNMISSMMAQQSGVLDYKIDFTLSDNEVEIAPNEIETKALTLLQTRCATCHEQHGSWQGYSTNNYILQGLIVAGDPSGSKIYQRITTSNLAQRMPPGASLGAEDPQIIRQWILNLKK